MYALYQAGCALTCGCALVNTKTRIAFIIEMVEDKLKPGKTFVFWQLEPKYNAVAVVGLGEKNAGCNDCENIDEGKEAVRVAAANGCRELQKIGVKTITIDDMGDPESAAEGSTLGLWKFQGQKSKKECIPEVELFSPQGTSENQLWNLGLIKAKAQNQARWLADMPANLMTPTIFAETVKAMFANEDVTVDIHKREWIEQHKMNAFLAVTKGSIEPPVFLEITYNKGKTDGPFILVGKGVTFDSGGISIKPSGSMDEMRADMGGAATCVAALQALASIQTEANIKVLIPLCENMPSGSAIKPGDIVTAMNGKTIGINNTDAEGRLILADALSYASTLKPKWIVDIATLTGAMRVALGSSATGAFTDSKELYESLEKAGSSVGDRVWRFPLWKQFTKEVTSEAAYDVNNIGKGKGGGSCSAAAFLKEFVGQGIPWVHLDIAGVMGPNTEVPYLCKGMTGRPTRTIIEFINQQVQAGR